MYKSDTLTGFLNFRSLVKLLSVFKWCCYKYFTVYHKL